MGEAVPKPEELARIQFKPHAGGWMDPAVPFRKGTWNYAAVPETLKYLDLPNPRKWMPPDEDWQLPDNWKEIVLEGLRDRLKKYRSLQIFMDICVRCGACADKCHFFPGRGAGEPQHSLPHSQSPGPAR